MFRRLINALGSLNFALFLIGGLAVILMVSTLLESRLGTPTAQRFFYEAGWFDVFLSLVGLNVVCSTLSRLPFRKKHTGFVVTHIGLLCLLVGSLISRLFGVEGQMVLFESEKQATILQSQYDVIVHRGAAGITRVALEPGSRKRFALDHVWPGLRLKVNDVWTSSERSLVVTEGPAEAEPNAAVRLHLESGNVGFDDSFWLVERDPSGASQNRLSLGPASFEIARARPRAAAPADSAKRTKSELYIAVRGSSDEAVLDLDKPLPSKLVIGKSGLTAGGFLYYPDTRVGDGNKLTTVSSEPRNPAIEFDLSDKEGKTHRIVYFALFPEFATLHGKEAGGPADLDIHFEFPQSAAAHASPRLLIETDGAAWYYKSFSAGGVLTDKFELGQTVETGWMDFRFRAEEFAQRARVETAFKKINGGGALAANLSLETAGREIWRGWIAEEEHETLPLLPPLADLVVGIGRRTAAVPFNLTLKDFRKVDYPGTQNAMSYESDVILEDPAERVAIHKTIKMNQPLDYKGFRIFQSSFMQDQSRGEGSVFTIAKNPGILPIYTGSIILFAGAIFVFFVKPFSTLKS